MIDDRILNLFSFLNNKEERFSKNVFDELTSLGEEKKFKNIPKEILDILICIYSFNNDDETKRYIEYYKSIGGSDELFKKVKPWMDDTFKNLKEFKSDKYPDSTFYGNSSYDILIEEDFNYDKIYISHEVFNTFKEDIDKEDVINKRDISDIFFEYIKNNTDIQGSGAYIAHIYYLI